MKIFTLIVLASSAFNAGIATAGGRTETPDNKLHIACAMKAGQTWQLKPNESVKTEWRRLDRNLWEFSVSHEQKMAKCVISENGQIDSFNEIQART